jgi:hypothetical protein
VYFLPPVSCDVFLRLFLVMYFSGLFLAVYFLRLFMVMYFSGLFMALF